VSGRVFNNPNTHQPGKEKVIDCDFKALSLHYNSSTSLFGSMDITKVHLTPPSALEFVLALESGRAMGLFEHLLNKIMMLNVRKCR